MKKLFLMLLLLTYSLGVTAQAPERTFEGFHELVVDVKQNIEDCVVTIIKDDIHYPIATHQIRGSLITLHLMDYEDYLIVINCEDYINITPMSWDIVDERDLSISADVDYQFENGILVFNF
jgi:hypothetical protein